MAISEPYYSDIAHHIDCGCPVTDHEPGKCPKNGTTAAQAAQAVDRANHRIEELAAANPGADDTNPKDLQGIKKPPLNLVPETANIFEAEVMALGAKKYGPYNWRTKKVKASIYVAAARRHLAAYYDGESDDPESGMPHLAHARACLGILLDAFATGNLVDDRPPPGAIGELIKQLTKD